MTAPGPPALPPAGDGVLVVVPTYDERENLPAVLARLHEALPGAHALVVDDASPDGTGELADALAAADDRVHVLHRGGKGGLGAAYVAGFGWALASAQAYAVLVEMDADGSHAPEELHRLLAAVEAGADVAIGSRWVGGGRVVDWPRWRMLLSRGGTAYVRFVLGLPVRDATGGYRAYRRSALQALDLTGVVSQGYCFQVDLAWRAHRAGLVIAEVPITFVERRLGRSKMDAAIVAEALWRVTAWAVARLVAGAGAREGDGTTRGATSPRAGGAGSARR